MVVKKGNPRPHLRPRDETNRSSLPELCANSSCALDGMEVNVKLKIILI